VRVAQHAKERARRADASQVGTEHILLGLLQEPEGIAAQALTRLGVVFRVVRDEIAKLPVAVGEGRTWSTEARQALECALDEAVELNAAMGRPGIVDTEHVLLALTRDPSCTAMRILRVVSVEPTRVRQEVLRLVRGVETAPAPRAETLVLDPSPEAAAPAPESPLPARLAAVGAAARRATACRRGRAGGAEPEPEPPRASRLRPRPRLIRDQWNSWT
jgi:ATP-dependent Clp protease ATP-binding subunit ClpC